MFDTNLLQNYYQKYGRDKVDDALTYLSYKHATEMPKTEIPGLPVLYIFRHGQSVDNEHFVFSGWRDADLTDNGREQALELAEKLKNKKIEMLVSSPQKRAVETMKLAVSLNDHAKNLEIHLDDRIKERSYGDLQGKSKLEIQLENPELLLKLRRDFKNVLPNGESIEQVCNRVAAFCDELVPLIKTNKINVAVSCHGNSIRGFRRYFEGLSDEVTATVETPLGKDYLAYTIR